MFSDDEIFCSENKDSCLDINKGKRQRSSNFTSQEEDVLMSLVEQHSRIVENKTTNAVSWKQKNDVWETIASQFGSQCNNIRSVKNLKDKYDNMKRKAKVALANDKKEFYKTGGGQYCSKVCDSDKRIQSLLGKSATGLYNESDCDSHNSLKQKEDDALDVEFLDEYKEVTEAKEPVHISIEENLDKSNSWSKWNPAKLKSNKAEKLHVKKRVPPDGSEQVLAKQAIFFENEDKRAEERHKLQVDELHLKLELLNLEISLKKLEIRKFN